MSSLAHGLYLFAGSTLWFAALLPFPLPNDVILGRRSSYTIHLEQRATQDTSAIILRQPIHSGVGRLVEDLVIGRGNSEPEYTFTSVSALTLGSDGSLYVVDADGLFGPYHVRKFDPNGKFVRNFGRMGDGPGEFRGPRIARELPDGRVVISDVFKLHLYTPDGRPIATLQHRISGAVASNRGEVFQLDRAGNIYWHQTRGVGSERETIVLRMNPSGSITDTLEWPSGALPARIATPLASERSPLIPFGASKLVDWSPLGYFVTATTSRYSVDIRRAATPLAAFAWDSDDRVLSLRREVAPVVLEGQERADWVSGVNKYVAASVPGWNWNSASLPQTKPPISGLFVAADGRIWVRLSQKGQLNAAVELPADAADVRASSWNPGRVAARWRERLVYDVLEPGGAYVGQVAFPEYFGDRSLVGGQAVKGDTVWATVEDQDGVPTVRRYVIQWER